MRSLLASQKTQIAPALWAWAVMAFQGMEGATTQRALGREAKADDKLGLVTGVTFRARHRAENPRVSAVRSRVELWAGSTSASLHGVGATGSDSRSAGGICTDSKGAFSAVVGLVVEETQVRLGTTRGFTSRRQPVNRLKRVVMINRPIFCDQA